MSASKTHNLKCLYFVSRRCLLLFQLRHLFWRINTPGFVQSPWNILFSLYRSQNGSSKNEREFLNYSQVSIYIHWSALLQCFSSAQFSLLKYLATGLRPAHWWPLQYRKLLGWNVFLFSFCILCISATALHVHYLPLLMVIFMVSACCILELPVGFRKEHTGVGLSDEVFVCCPADAFVVLLLVWTLQRERCLHFWS